MSFIELSSVYKKYKMGEVTINALDGVSFSVEQGELCMIVGPSGAGKTTVLNILGGIDSCDDGKVRVGGELINNFSEKRTALYRRHDVGFVFQFYNLVPNLTALENVELATQISNKSLSPDKVLERVGLGERMNNFPAQLSGGEQAFVAIAIYFAILRLRPAPFCILDEIEAALDDMNVTRYARYLHNFTDTTQFITVTHRRGTMEEADVMYGVTMQEKGISRLLKMEQPPAEDLTD